MAITPRSFVLNPRLLLVASIAILTACAVFLTGIGNHGAARLSYWESVRQDCAPQDSEAQNWSESTWESHVYCFLDSDRYTAAYAAANEAVRYHPRSESLLNLRGYAAARNGDHAVAAYDFRQGLRITGSPSGIFENNLAWTMLWQLDHVDSPRAASVLHQSRALYETSLSKGSSCERVHTGLYVEYAIASQEARSNAQGRNTPAVRAAVDRYSRLWNVYEPCWQRVQTGDDLVVEEILSAAVIDQEMGYLAGIRRPTRHIATFDQAVARGEHLDITVDDAFCAKAHPTNDATEACRALLR